MTNANIPELIKLQKQYHIGCLKKTIRYAFKTKPELFAHIKDPHHTEAEETVPVIIKHFLYDFFRFCDMRVLYAQFCILYNQDLYGINTKTYCEEAIRKLYNEAKQEQHTFPLALLCEQIMKRKGIEYERA